jgi:hypothetical protein
MHSIFIDSRAAARKSTLTTTIIKVIPERADKLPRAPQSLTLSPELIAALRGLAAVEGRSLAGLVTILVHEAINQRFAVYRRGR